jgi:hypothetical protein
MNKGKRLIGDNVSTNGITERGRRLHPKTMVPPLKVSHSAVILTCRCIISKTIRILSFASYVFAHHVIYHEPLLIFICEGSNLGTGLSTILETDGSRETTNWLHTNYSYVLGRRGPHTDLCGTLHTSDEPCQHINHILFWLL